MIPTLETERLAGEHHTLGARHWGLTLRGEDTVRGLLGYNEIVDEHARAAIGSVPHQEFVR